MDSGSRNLRRVIPAIVLLTLLGVACGSPSVFSQKQPQQVPSVNQAAPGAQSAPPAAAIDNAKPTFVEFYTTWCAPCKQMTPIVDKLRDEYGTRVDFKILDAAGATAEKQKYRYVTQPQMVIVNRKGEIVDTLYGVQGYNGLKKILDTVLAQPVE